MDITLHKETILIIKDANIWEVVTALGTISAVVVAVFHESFWKWWRRPILQVSFDRNLERCFRFAVATQDDIMEHGTFHNVWRQYFRLEVKNIGATQVNNLKAKVELINGVTGDLADRFEPSLLQWVSGNETITLGGGEVDYLNLISEVIRPVSKSYPTRGASGQNIDVLSNIHYRLRTELSNKDIRGIAWDRSPQKWNLLVTFHSDSLLKSVTKLFQFTPSSDGSPGELIDISDQINSAKSY